MKRHGVRFQMLWCGARSAATADVLQFQFDLSKEYVELVVLLPELPNWTEKTEDLLLLFFLFNMFLNSSRMW